MPRQPKGYHRGIHAELGSYPAPERYDNAPGIHTPVAPPLHANSRYNPELAYHICTELMMGKSLKKICVADDMPNIMTVMRWLANPALTDFHKLYYHARRIAAEGLIDEVIEIADDDSNDWKPVRDDNGNIIGHKPDNEAIQRSRVKIDTRKWLAAKMVPRLYGDKIDVDLGATGELAEMIANANNKTKGLPDPVDEQ